MAALLEKLEEAYRLIEPYEPHAPPEWWDNIEAQFVPGALGRIPYLQLPQGKLERPQMTEFA